MSNRGNAQRRRDVAPAYKPGNAAPQKKPRKHRRRACHYSALIDVGDGSVLRSCNLVDVSEGGAKLITDSSGLIPDVFTLLLSGNGAVRRACVVVWRSETAIGVQFLPSVSSGQRAGAAF